MNDIAVIALLIFIFLLFYGFTIWCSGIESEGD